MTTYYYIKKVFLDQSSFKIPMRASILLIIVFCHYTNGVTQFSYSPNQYNFEKLGPSNGLSDLRVPYFFQDSRGYIWISTRDGINRYNGKDSKVFRPSIDSHISSQAFEDLAGYIWFTTYSGLHRVDPYNDDIQTIFLNKTNSKKSPSDHFLFHYDTDNKLWVVADSMVHIFDPENQKDSILHKIISFACVPIVNKQGEVTGIVDPLTSLRVGVSLFLYKDPITQKDTLIMDTIFSQKHNSYYPDASVYFPLMESDSVLWLPTDIGLIKTHLNKPTQYKIFFEQLVKKEAIRLWDIERYSQNTYYITSLTHGLLKFDSFLEKLVLINDKNLPRNSNSQFYSLNNVYIDNGQNIWVSMWGEGVYFSSPNNLKFKNLINNFNRNQLSVSEVSDIAEDKFGNIWSIISDHKLTVFDHDLKISNYHERKINAEFTRDKEKLLKVYADSEGDIWIATSERVLLWEVLKASFQTITTQLKDLENIFEISPDKFLVMVFEKLLFFEKSKILSLQRSGFQFIQKHQWLDIFKDNRGFIYASDIFDNLYIFRLNGDKLMQLKKIEGTGYINSMVQDFAGTIWFTGNKGLHRLKTGNDKFNLERISVFNQNLNSLQIDDSGNLWLSTNYSLIKYHPKMGILAEYGADDGLGNMQFSLGSSLRLQNGNLAFGSTGGLILFNPEEVKSNPTVPGIHIESITINDDENLEGFYPLETKPLVLDYERNTLSLSFSAIEYSAPDSNQFKYFMEGYDSDTVESGTKGFARYPNLPPQKYTFKIWASNSDNVWTKEPKELLITINPPFWQTWWFYTLCTLAALILFYLLYRYRVQQIQRRETFKRKEAEYKTLVAETETAVLRLQMNPHFIFNSMNSISSYILQRDVETANSYLLRFSKLMRMILDLAAQPYITVGEEAELLDKYLEAEAMRLERRFDYQLDIAQGLDPDDIILPTMILQPFVENAIWHGMRQKESQGMIKVSFALEGEEILCAVEDNGIGRKAASQNRPTHKNHVSRALEITRKRLDLLKEEHKKEASYEVIDLEDAAGGALGTKVVLRLPVL